MQHEGLAQMCCLIRAPRKTFSSARPSEHQGENVETKLKTVPVSNQLGPACEREGSRGWACRRSAPAAEPAIWAPGCVRSNFYLHAFAVSLETGGSAAVTLVPIAPPGGGGESDPECSRSHTEPAGVDRPREGEKPLS